MPTPAQELLNEIYDSRLCEREAVIERWLSRFVPKDLVLDMGLVIRNLDESGEHSEFWTQDDDYIIDGRFSK